MQLPYGIKKHLLISEPGRGKTVFFHPDCEDDSMKLRIAESKRDYRAVMIMNHLRALSSGLNGKSNVFIPNTRDAATISGHVFIVYVPGVKAEVVVTPEDCYMVRGLEIDPDAFEAIQNGKTQRPGMYSVTIGDGDNLKVEKNKQDEVTAINGRTVVIADGGSKSAEEAAIDALPKLANIIGDVAANSKKFDLFHSPGSGRFGGMLSRNPMTIDKANVCSSLLAQSMLASRDNGVKDVAWASDYGGSAVLTQALEVLARTQPAGSFDKSNHLVKMYKATTTTSYAVTSAKKLGINFDKNITRGQVSCLVTNLKRAADKNDEFGWEDVGSDLNKGVALGLGTFGAITLVATSLVSAGVAPSVVAAAAGWTGLKTAGFCASWAGTIQFVGGLGFEQYKSIKRK